MTTLLSSMKKRQHKFSYHVNITKIPPPPPVFVNGHKLGISSSFIQLGFSISSNLTWKPHVNSIEKRASQKLGFLSRARGYFSPSQLLNIYKSQIRSSLEYCSHVCGGAPKTSLHLLDRVQLKAIRLIALRKSRILFLIQ